MASLDLFAQHLLLHNDSVVYDKRAETVTLITLHASKGLEFKVVFIVGLEEGFLPVKLRQDDISMDLNEHIEEEYRIFYVGITRAEEVLYLSYVQKRKMNGAGKLQQSSRFLREIPSERVVPMGCTIKSGSPERKVKQLSLFEII